MPSKVEICNMALSEISADLINSLDHPYESKEAKTCDLYFNNIRKEVLRGFEWNFAVTTRALGLSTATNNFGFTYTYLEPNDCLRVIRIRESVDTSDGSVIYPTVERCVDIPYYKRHDRTLNKSVILTNCESAFAEYIADIETVALFDENFVTAFVYRLAASIAKPLLGAITGSNVSAQMFQLYSLALRNAEALSALEEQPKEDTCNYYVDERSSTGYYYTSMRN